jgi:hypothetical protein
VLDLSKLCCVALYSDFTTLLTFAVHVIRCTCKAGWQGETCNQDIDECKAMKFLSTCDMGPAKQCMATLADGLPQGCHREGFAVAAGLRCDSPYWVDSKTHLPSGCDRDRTDQPEQQTSWFDRHHECTESNEASCPRLTTCQNVAGSWTCGACKETPSCCNPVAMTQPTVEINNVSWYTSPAHTVCESDATHPLCNTSATWQASGCTGIATERSTAWLEWTAAALCQNATDHCSCKPGETRVDKQRDEHCVQAPERLALRIDPRDQHGRLSAENGITDLGTFSIELQGKAQAQGTTTLQPCNNSSVNDGVLHWNGTGFNYWLHFLCHISGSYQLHVSAKGVPVTRAPLHIRLIPDMADSGATLAQLNEPGWCLHPSDHARARCRTLPGHNHTVLVRVRDQYANERQNLSDAIVWEIRVAAPGYPRRARTLTPSRIAGAAVWRPEERAYSFNFGLDDAVDDKFVLSISINQNETWTPWEPDHNGKVCVWKDDGVMQAICDADHHMHMDSTWLSARTVVTYAVSLLSGLNATACQEMRCHSLQSLPHPGTLPNGKMQPWNLAEGDKPTVFTKWSENKTGCQKAGCLLSTDGLSLNVSLDWFPDSRVSLELTRFCTTRKEMFGNQYWNRDQCHTNQAWNGSVVQAGECSGELRNSSCYDGGALFDVTQPSWNQAAEFMGSVQLNFARPATYYLKVSVLDPPNITTRFSLPQLHSVVFGNWQPIEGTVLLDVAPGSVSLDMSYMLQPIVIPHSDTDPQVSMPTSGRRWASLELGMLDTDLAGEQYRFETVVLDRNGNPRGAGKDEMKIEISRLPVDDPRLSNEDKRHQQALFQQTTQFKRTVMTPGLCGVTMNKAAKEEFCGPVGWNNRAQGGAHVKFQQLQYGHDNGTLSFDQYLNQHGVFRASIYVCGALDAMQCKDIASQNSESNKLNRTDFIFTVCPQNSNVTDHALLDPHTYVLKGSQLDACKCKSGFRGQQGKGEPCYACEIGQYSQSTGSTRCTKCEPGKQCNCKSQQSAISSEDNCTRNGWSPACSICTVCKEGYFQHQTGKATCIQCRDGFDCMQTGMTYPLATPGFWVDGGEPKKMASCKPEQACPGSILYQMQTNSMRQPDQDESPCFKKPPPENGYEFDNNCLQVFGSRCATGYAGDQCGECCKTSTGRELSCDGAMWFRSSGVCRPCDSQSSVVIAGTVLFVGVILGPILLKIAEVARHMGALSGPIMSAVNFFRAYHQPF